jgi:hypothetical protein
VFNTYKIINSGSWIAVVLDKFAPSYIASNEEPAPSTPKEPRELPELSRAILRELAKDSRNILVIQTKLAPELLAEVKASGLPIIDLGAYLESLRARGKDPYYWPVTRMQGHWNHAAQPLIGKFLAEQIRSRIIFLPD